MPIITRAQLAVVAPKADPKIAAAIANYADDVLPRYGLTTAARLQHFMAHVLVESAYLTAVEENMSYTAERLCAVWPSRFPTVASAAPFARNPEALANKVYGGRLGNTGADDGWLNRGAGLLQTTGADWRKKLAAKLGKTVDEVRTMLVSPAGMLECAAATYVLLGAPAYADKGDIVGETRCINGGTNGLDDRKAMLAKCQKLWPAVATPGPFLVDTASPVLAGIQTAMNQAAAAQGAPKPAPIIPPVVAPPHLLPPPAKPGFWASLIAKLTGKAA